MGRRKKEVKLFVSDEYSSNGFIEELDTDGHGHQLQHTAKDIDVRSYLGI